jgi:hypothetical protein
MVKIAHRERPPTGNLPRYLVANATAVPTPIIFGWGVEDYNGP